MYQTERSLVMQDRVFHIGLTFIRALLHGTPKVREELEQTLSNEHL